MTPRVPVGRCPISVAIPRFLSSVPCLCRECHGVCPPPSVKRNFRRQRRFLWHAGSSTRADRDTRLCRLCGAPPARRAGARGRLATAGGHHRGRHPHARGSGGDAAHLSLARRRHRPRVRQLGGDRAGLDLDPGAHRVRRLRSGCLSGRGVGPLRRDRPRRQSRGAENRLCRHRRLTTVGRRPRDPESGRHQPESRLVPLGGQVRSVLPRRRDALQRQLPRPPESWADAPAGQLLVDLERAQFRRGPRAAGDRWLVDLRRPGHVSKPRERGLERPTGDRPRSRHDPDRRARRAGPCRHTRCRAPGRAPRRLLADQAAAVPAHVVLRRSELPRASRLRGENPRLSDHGRGLGGVPHTERRPVRSDRRRRSPVRG